MALPKIYAYNKHNDYIGSISPSFILVPDNLWLGRSSMYMWVIAGYRLLCEADVFDICRLFCSDIFTYRLSYKVLDSGIIDISQHSSRNSFSFYFYFIYPPVCHFFRRAYRNNFKTILTTQSIISWLKPPRQYFTSYLM